jgi:hypothetical protein
MPILLVEFFIITINLAIFIICGYYLLKIRSKENELEKKTGVVDANYHQIVDNALSKERIILNDAAAEADKILVDAEYVKKSAEAAVDKALQQMVANIQSESTKTAGNFMSSYSNSLSGLANNSLTDFKTVAKTLEGDLQKQMQEFRDTLLPNLEKELENYKQIRLKQSEELINRIVQTAAEEIFNKSISLEDHQKLLFDCLEKAKAEGVFS